MPRGILKRQEMPTVSTSCCSQHSFAVFNLCIASGFAFELRSYPGGDPGPDRVVARETLLRDEYSRFGLNFTGQISDRVR